MQRTLCYVFNFQRSTLYRIVKQGGVVRISSYDVLKFLINWTRKIKECLPKYLELEKRKTLFENPYLTAD